HVASGNCRRKRRQVARGTRMTQPALLLAAHGSPDPAHARTVEALRRKVAVTWPGAVAHGFLDHDQPLVGSALLSLAAGGSLDVIAVPLLLTPAYHRRVDIPAAVTPLAALSHRST